MKTIISKEWSAHMLSNEPECIVSAGEPIDWNQRSLKSYTIQSSQMDEHRTDESRMAFEQFAKLSRRKRGLSIEELAEQTDLDIAELYAIETDPGFKPEPRTVFQLANYYKVSRPKLMALAGLTVLRDGHMVEEAVRYAAKSASVASLNDQEQTVFDGLIAILSEK